MLTLTYSVGVKFYMSLQGLGARVVSCNLRPDQSKLSAINQDYPARSVDSGTSPLGHFYSRDTSNQGKGTLFLGPETWV